MVFTCWFMFLNLYVFLIKCFDLFFLVTNFRLMAYNKYSAWVHHYKILGRGKRIVIPTSVISSIRGDFSSSTNNYTGLKEFIDLKV